MDIYLSEDQAIEGCKLAERDPATLTEEESKRLLDLEVRAHFTLGLHQFYSLVETEKWKIANNLK